MSKNRIGELRAEAAQRFPALFTKTALASRLGVNVRTVSRWEDGDMRPNVRLAKRLAKELGVSVDDLGLDGPAEA